MSVDTATRDALSAEILRWRALCYADFQGDPLRATTSPYGKTVAGSGDSELDGTYDPISHDIVEISPIQHGEDGSETVVVSLSGLIVNNAEFLSLIGDSSKWQGRIMRLWFFCVDENESQVGSIVPYYTGYMSKVHITGSPEEQTVSVEVENYIDTLAGSGGKTYAMQKHFDSGDNSASATLAAANGIEGSSSGTKSYVRSK